ncbi:DUF805 domain-containing protein [Marinobacter sp.]|uniref:DUF805 domain-containing protein n=1 Tax=Marinobacter sp. TaxID=50741 RepID=UPI00261381C9|nr:DUF805 domain-containing protein [Marinobacter sp.]
MEHFTAAFSNFANFSGRATRTQFWMFFLIYMVITVVLAVIETALGMPVLTPIFGLVLLIPSLSYGARRLHDIGRSGWWQLLMLIPVIGLIILLVMFALHSKEEAASQFSPQTS